MKEKLNRLEQTSSQKQNEQEHKMQLELKRRYESVQPLGAVVPSEAEKKT